MFIPIDSLEDVEKFKVVKEQLYDINGKDVPGAFTIRREDTETHFGTVGPRYVPIQLDDMLSILDVATDRIDGLEYDSYTVVGNGKRVVLKSVLAEGIAMGDDKLDGLIYTVIDNTGAGSNKIIPSTVRIYCDNAFHLIEKRSADTIRHSRGFATSVDDIVTRVVADVDTIQRFPRTMERLSGTKFTKNQMSKYSQMLVPVEEDESAQRGNKREELVRLFSEGRGNAGETAWDAFNAVTEYESSSKRNSPEKLVRQLMGGAFSRQAFNSLKQMLKWS